MQQNFIVRFNMSSILVTAIGSMSAECVITSLKKHSHKIIGCDIYPQEWLYTANKCNEFYQVPLSSQHDLFISEIVDICTKESVDYIFPLTDIDIDFFNEHRDVFQNIGVVICISNSSSIKVARDKFTLHNIFMNDPNVPSIPTMCGSSSTLSQMKLPLIAKYKNGRSSIGLQTIENMNQLHSIRDIENYIFQEKIEGPVYTVDYIRNSQTETSFCIPRQELIRTPNGAGLTIQISNNERVKELTYYIGEKLNIEGYVNMEFIFCESDFYLIDINPRPSAGVVFSKLAGYDMPLNHLRCFSGEDIDPANNYNEFIATKSYFETIIK